MATVYHAQVTTCQRPSRYHIAKQHDGFGWMILRLDEIGSASATVIDCNLPESTARDRLVGFRNAEAVHAEYPLDAVIWALGAAERKTRAS